jgi:hypothetical protein
MTFGCDVPSAVHAEGCVPKAGGAPARLLFSEQTNRRGLVHDFDHGFGPAFEIKKFLGLSPLFGGRHRHKEGTRG